MTDSPLIGSWRAAAAARWGDKPALCFEGEEWTFSQLGQWQSGIMRWLRLHAVAPGERVLWQLPNSPLALVLHDAIVAAGAVSVPVPMLYRQHELEYIVSDAEPALIVAPDTYRGRAPTEEIDRVLRSTGFRPRVLACAGGATDGWSLLAGERDIVGSSIDPSGIDDRPTPAGEADPVLVLYTSGSTARPKGVIHTSRSLVSAARLISAWCELGSDDCFFTGAPVAHIAGLLAVGILPLVTGGKAVLLPAWDVESAASAIDRERATFSCGATVFLQELVELYERDESYSHRLGRFICGGATIPPSLIVRAHALGIFAFRSWGMTEAPMIGMARPSDPLDIRSETDGRVCTGALVQAVDSDRRPLPDGSVGELRIRADQQMAGYTDPMLTGDQVDEAGWFYTGDVGVVSDGAVTMTGRLKDIINRGGEKFSAQDIENAIGDHPVVRAVAVFPAYDERLGERVAAAIELQVGALWPGDDALVGYLSGRGLARQKIPETWHILESLPRTPSGKIRKEALRAEFGRRRGAG